MFKAGILSQRFLSSNAWIAAEDFAMSAINVMGNSIKRLTHKTGTNMILQLMDRFSLSKYFFLAFAFQAN